MHIEAYDIETLRKIVRSLQNENKSLKKKLKELNIPFENIFPFEETFERKWNKCGFTNEVDERFAVIDNEIVWHGGMNLLGKEDVWDNLIRIKNKDVASELLEIELGNI